MPKCSVRSLAIISLGLAVLSAAAPRAAEAPWLAAPGDLSVRAGRGALLLYVLDNDGQRVPKRGGRCGWEEAYQRECWAVITGVVDHRRLRENMSNKLRIAFAAAHPRYKRLDVERQERAPGGEWSGWEEVDFGANNAVIFNLSEEEAESTPDDVRLQALVDPLPILQAGRWEGVDVARLAGRANLEPPDVELSYPTSNAPELMLRFFDFTVRPGRSYRYRLRVVVYNPNDEVDARYLTGPWSPPTTQVSIPVP
jgi:hypothetical protein